MSVSDLFDPSVWAPAPHSEAFTDITAHRSHDGAVARIAFNRPEVRNAFRPHTVDELYAALEDAADPRLARVLLTGNGPSAKDGGWAFCSRRRPAHPRARRVQVLRRQQTRSRPSARAGRLHILEVQRLIRFMPKVVIAVVPGWAAGGGHSLHVVCDLTVASRRARQVQADRCRCRQFDAGYGTAYMAPPDRPEVRARGVLPRR